MSQSVVSKRALNRALLARQLLLVRAEATPLKAIEALAGLQAQLARPPFVGLWSRIEGFRRQDLLGALRRRSVVRATMMRHTLHLVSARHYLELRAVVQPALTAALQSVLGARAKGLDVEELVELARELFEQQPRPFGALRPLLAERFAGVDERALGYAVRTHLPLVQVPTDATWGFPRSADFAVAESWIGKPLREDANPHELVKRYLAAFGPATPADAQTWSGLRGLSEVFEQLRSRLKVMKDERGRELFDLPRAPRPPEDSEAPLRFVPDYDNLILGHAERSRIVADAYRPALITKNLQVPATFLVDGFVAGTWKIERKKKTATLLASPFAALSKKVRAELEEEAERLLGFVEPDASSHQVRIVR